MDNKVLNKINELAVYGVKNQNKLVMEKMLLDISDLCTREMNYEAYFEASQELAAEESKLEAHSVEPVVLNDLPDDIEPIKPTKEQKRTVKR